MFCWRFRAYRISCCLWSKWQIELWLGTFTCSRHSSHNREFHSANCRFCGAFHNVDWANISVLSQIIRNVNERKTHKNAIYNIDKFNQFIVVCRTYVCYNISSATIQGRRLVLTPEDCDLWLHRNLLAEILLMEGLRMLTTNLFIAIISLCITCFALGYTIGSKSNNKTQK